VSRARPVVSGAGAICSAGARVADIWNAAASGRGALGRVAQWQSASWSQPSAGEIAGLAPAALIADRKVLKYLGRGDVLGLHAALVAIDDAGWLAFRDTLGASAADRFNDATGVFVGSGGATFAGAYDFLPALAAGADDPRQFARAVESTVDPLWLLRNLPNNVLGHLGIRCGFKGPNACITHHAVSGALAVAEAAATLAAGDAERAVAVGHHAPIEPQAVLGFEALGLLARDGLTPFDARRSGTLLGEGSAAIALERPASAEARGARRCGELLGSGCVTEAEGLLDVRSDGDGPSRAIELALDDAGIAASDVGMIVAHGNGTPQSDASEAAALSRVFAAATPPVTSFKWLFGHLLAAAGAMDVVLALESLRRGIVPGIATLDELDPAFEGLPLSKSAQAPRSDVALVLSRGFGGMNVALVVRGVAR
jgi:3-oxoacyl-[acyl-carrier-protein] synthase-1